MKTLVAATILTASFAAAADTVVTMNLVDDKGTGAEVGTVTISESKYGLVFTPALHGLPPGLHGFHVHANASCAPAAKDGKSVAALAAGGHLRTDGLHDETHRRTQARFRRRDLPGARAPLCGKLIVMSFFFEVLIGGLLSGVMYSLVALGFVLIYKASGVFNFAQGAMVFFAALTFVSLVERGMSFWFAVPVTLAAMVVLGLATERFVLRPLVNQPQITLFMATIGLTFVIEGVAQLLWGSQPHNLDLGIQDEPIAWINEVSGMSVSKFDLAASGIAAVLVISLALFFSRTRIGRALRAVADDHQAALAVGIPLQQIWGIVWAVAGFVALVAGMLWGACNGVQFALTFLALKALPVLILGGLESVPGAIVGGLIIGASEKLAEVYIGPYVGGGIEGWFPYVLALLFLLVRPEGLFGEKHIDRV